MGIGHPGLSFPEQVEWSEIKVLSEQQGLSAIALDGVEKLPESFRPPKEFLLQWIGEVLQSYEQRCLVYKKTISEMAGFYNSHGFKMMVLKGYACSLDWPKPEHRPCGDIDIWLFGKQIEADASLGAEKRIKIDTSEHHHTVFYWRDFMVENHYDFINVHHHKSNKEIEKVLKDLGQDDRYSTELHGERVYLPSPNLHALFLLKHLMMHFASEGITFRQLLDWGFFVEKHNKDVDWEWLDGVLMKNGMKPLFQLLNAICVENLGFDLNIFPKIQIQPVMKGKVLNEIINPKYSRKLPQGFIKRALFKYRRWKASEWKHQLCYKESMWSAFWSGVWNHILKPSSI